MQTYEDADWPGKLPLLAGAGRILRFAQSPKYGKYLCCQDESSANADGVNWSDSHSVLVLDLLHLHLARQGETLL